MVFQYGFAEGRFTELFIITRVDSNRDGQQIEGNIMEDWSAPLTESQLGLVVVQKSIPVPHLYNILIELSLASTVTTYAVKYALTSLIEVQPALRLAFRDLQALLVSPLSIADLPLREIVAQDALSRR